MNVVQWHSEDDSLAIGEEIKPGTKIKNTLAIITNSYDLTGCRTTTILFFGPEAEARDLAERWDKFAKECDKDEDDGKSTINTNTDTEELLKEFARQSSH